MPVDTVYFGCSPVLSCGTGCEAALWVVGCDLFGGIQPPSQRTSVKGHVQTAALARAQLWCAGMEGSVWVCMRHDDHCWCARQLGLVPLSQT